MNSTTLSHTDTLTTTMAATTLQPNPNTTNSTPAPLDTEVEVFGDFEAMDLKETLLRGIFSYGLEKPSAIQTKQSGTGKTAAFSIGMLNQLDTSRPGTQALILSPTRDLALQTHRVVAALVR